MVLGGKGIQHPSPMLSEPQQSSSNKLIGSQNWIGLDADAETINMEASTLVH